ncbi:Rossmann-like and DUF2520 domain-containing protein [Pedobacter jejuensis]|uniref:DUF2520 domain-containing protein n=1 Tax=Pedobacter jejuensis TaxID=1268550 RepID=A0A3N0BWE4_9SPHI|nr:Rossmann-like and DUF2520 domain-containing protein [Pedobacter jejuensis]RNL54034.1 DUF2520 domain-containing protein [Pedobacter jejuensis]
MKIVIIGSGNVATHLSLALKAAGEEIVQVFSLNLNNAETLAKRIQAEPISNISKINRLADLYIICVKDDAISEIAKEFNDIDGLVVHTSGSTDIKVLSSELKHVGVFYPLQTFSKTKDVDFANIPVCIEATDAKQLDILKNIAHKLSSRVYTIDSEQRRVLHLAAVFACNFTNHMYAMANQILLNNNIDFDIIKPLITETADKILNDLPENVQTGPAVRNDDNTINKHLNMLADLPKLQEIYITLSNSIKLSHKIV